MHQVLIIGSGPAGLTAAIYAARAQLNPLVIEGLEPGGQLTLTTIIENWPGYPQGIDGTQLMADMKEQAARFGTAFKRGEVTAVDFLKKPLSITWEGETLEAECVIIATGASAQLLGLPAEKKLMGRGVSVCATCDGFFFRKKDILVVGGGDTALEEAIFLSNLASTVTVVHRRDKLRASKIMQQRAFDTKNLSFIWDSVIEDIKDEDRGMVTGAVIRNVKTGETHLRTTDGIFVAIGHKPNTDIFKGQVEMDHKGYIITKCGASTNIPGVYAAGDVTDPIYRQAVTSAGMGCMAALDAEKFIRGL
jgi:thioredoxin reductase (NADPH)